MKAKDKAIIWMTTKENMAFNLGRKIALKARDEEIRKVIDMANIEPQKRKVMLQRLGLK